MSSNSKETYRSVTLEGVDAYWKGKSYKDNPYPFIEGELNYKREQWFRGWAEAASP